MAALDVQNLAATACAEVFGRSSKSVADNLASPAASAPTGKSMRAGGRAEGGRVPFSKENIRYTINAIGIYSIGCVTIIVMGVLTSKGHGSENITITGFVGAFLAMAWHSLQAERNKREAKQDRAEILDKVNEAAAAAQDVKRATNGGLTKAVETVAEKVLEAAAKPLPGQEAMPKTPEELHKFLENFAEKYAPKLCEVVAREAAERAAKEAAVIAAREAAEKVAAEFRRQM